MEHLVDTPTQEATTSDVATTRQKTGAMDLVKAGTVSEMNSEMFEAIASLFEDTAKAILCDYERNEM